MQISGLFIKERVSSDKMELTILMPCLNEEKTIELFICKALDFLKKYHIDGEILIVDNGSQDNSAYIIKKWCALDWRT